MLDHKGNFGPMPITTVSVVLGTTRWLPQDGSYATIAARLKERYAGLLDRTAFYQPDQQPTLDDPRLPHVIQEFNQ